ncbi:hypothetical protein [Streptomyces mexicanus]|uniref:hypothetical protein n=1 Tax=Streptomyces mexicanus TaxID=178566 RepID=UPI00367F8FEB
MGAQGLRGRGTARHADYLPGRLPGDGQEHGLLPGAAGRGGHAPTARRAVTEVKVKDTYTLTSKA